MSDTIFDYIKKEEIAYQTLPVSIVENYEWNMSNHVKLTVLYKNSQYSEGKRGDKPFKNIIRPILNLAYRAEGFDVKDISLFVDDPDDYYKSFLIKKFHEKWARENGIDTFIDDMVESYVDFGGALVKNVNNARPEVVPLQSVAFVDQTDILGGPICIKHSYSPDQLKDMEANHWGDAKYGATTTIDELIALAKSYREESQTIGKQSKTPGKHIEVYELHGTLPDEWLNDEAKANDGVPPVEGTSDASENKFTRQMQIVAFYKDEKGEKKGLTLFKSKEKHDAFKIILRDKIYGRALGLGGAEELFEPQIWTNYDQIHIKNMLDAASKVILKTTDTTLAAKHPSGLKDLENLEVIELAAGADLSQVETFPNNLALFERSIEEWDEHAKEMGSASPALLGTAPTNHTSFAFQRLITQQATALHDYRRGKLATFMDEIYRDWILPYIVSEIVKGQKFLAELTLEELQQVAESLVTCQTNDMIKAKVLNGEQIDPNEVEAFTQKVKAQFMKGGSKRFIEIFKDELKDAPIDVQTDIAGKQKDLGAFADAITGILKQVIAAPQVLDDPRFAKLFNMILESSGFSPIDFSSPPSPPQNNGPSDKISESINFKDLPPDGKVQLAAKAGIKIAPAAPLQTQQQ